MAIHTPERKVEQSIVSYFQNGFSNVGMRTRFSGKIKTLPCVDVVCDEAVPRNYDDSNHVLSWVCNLKLTVRTQYIKEDSEEGTFHDILTGGIADLVAGQSVIEALNVFGATYGCQIFYLKPGRRVNKVVGTEYQTELSVEIWLAPLQGN